MDEKMKVRFVKLVGEEAAENFIKNVNSTIEQRKSVERKYDPQKMLDAYFEAREKTDENPFLFTCPYCGGQAKGGYIEYNGHIRIQCDCGVKIME